MKLCALAALVALQWQHAASQSGAVVYAVARLNVSAPNGFDLVTAAAPIPVDPATSISWATYNDSVAATGWGTLEVHTNAAFNESTAAFAAGFVEGAITWERGHAYAKDAIIDAGQTWPTKLKKYVDDNVAYVKAQAAAHGATDSFWFQTGLVFNQLDGLYAGYQYGADGSKALTYYELYAATLMGDLMDLDSVYDAVAEGSRLARRRRSAQAKKRVDHCSALVKVLQGADGMPADLAVSHATWAGFETMNRIYKLYDFPWRLLPSDAAGALVPAQRVAFSSYPLTLYSTDDFYTMSTGLVVQETTVDNNNASLWAYIKPTTVLCWARAMVANRLATDAHSWASLFARENSGTYNNEWMAVDFNKFTPGQPLQDGTLWVLVQMPGPFVAASDHTAWLRSGGYWASYNLVSDAALAALSGQDALQARYGDYYSWANTSRARIFAREQAGVRDLGGVRRLMRLNEYQTDPEATLGCKKGWRSATNAIADRSDLTDAAADCLDDLQQGDSAGVDAKVTAHSMMMAPGAGVAQLAAVAQSGPSYDTQPAFAFSNETLGKIPHTGLPDLWVFPWVTIAW